MKAPSEPACTLRGWRTPQPLQLCVVIMLVDLLVTFVHRLLAGVELMRASFAFGSRRRSPRIRRVSPSLHEIDVDNKRFASLGSHAKSTITFKAVLSAPVNRRSVKLYPLSLVATAAAAADDDDDDNAYRWAALISICRYGVLQMVEYDKGVSLLLRIFLSFLVWKAFRM